MPNKDSVRSPLRVPSGGGIEEQWISTHTHGQSRDRPWCPLGKLTYLRWITNKDLLFSTRNCAQRQVSAWMGGELGGEWVRVYIAESLSVHLKLSEHR